MTSRLELPRKDLIRLAEGIGLHPVRGLSRRKLEHRRLAEHFECWNLDCWERFEPGMRLEAVAQRTALTHHQIRSDAGARQFALSSEGKGPDKAPEVVAVYSSGLSQRIDQAIQWIDTQETGKTEKARLLFVPFPHIHAIWLYTSSQDRLVIASKPRIGRILTCGRMYSVSEFLSALDRLSDTVGSLIGQGAVAHAPVKRRAKRKRIVR